jgi:hypothetical protein
MILIISDKSDVHTQKVEYFLKENSSEYVKLNIDVQSLKKTIIRFQGLDWEIESPTGNFTTEEISVIWNRRTYVELLLDEIDNQDVGFKIWKGEWNKTLLGIYSFLETKKWLNFYRDSYYAENKYRQFLVAKKLGFNVPSFICANDRVFLKSFFSNDKEKVIKFMNQDFYRTETEGYKGIYVNKIKECELEIFQEFGENPIILQDYIDKSFEVRYTIVGDEHFVCKIDSQSSKIANIDWRRYDLPNTPHEIIKPPASIKKKVVNLMSEFNLRFGAMDFIVSKDGEWYFLELNSMGQFLWLRI